MKVGASRWPVAWPSSNPAWTRRSPSSRSPARMVRTVAVAPTSQRRVGWPSSSVRRSAASKRRLASSMSPAWARMRPRSHNAWALMTGSSSRSASARSSSVLARTSSRVSGERMVIQRRSSTTASVAASPQRRAMARASSARCTRRSQSPVHVISAARAARRRARVGVSSAPTASTAASRAAMRSWSTSPVELGSVPRVFASTARARALASPRSAARREASSNVSRWAVSPALRCASPSAMSSSMCCPPAESPATWRSSNAWR